MSFAGISIEVTSYLERAMQLKNALDALRPLDPEQESIIMQKFRLDWNYHSNHLEGNTLTYGETKALILFNITASGKPLKDHIEMEGHNEAINWIIEIVKDERPITENFIRELHTLLLKKPYKKDATTAEGQPTTRTIQVGQYKSAPNHVKTVSGEIFRFSTPEETPAEMNDLIEWFRSEKGKMNPIILAATFHYKFIRIHPFDDGNGRTARILMNFILLSFGYPPVIVKTEDKENYFAVLRQADAGLLQPFIEYISKNLIDSLELMIKGAKGENISDPDDLDKELALLDHSIKDLNENALFVSRSPEVVNNLYSNFILPVFGEFYSLALKFEKYYAVTNFSLFLNNERAIIESNDPPEIYFPPKISAGTNKLDFSVSYTTFKNSSKDINNKLIITFLLESTKYSLTTNLGQISRNYKASFPSLEALNLLQTLFSQHTKTLKGLIDEEMRHQTDNKDEE